MNCRFLYIAIFALATILTVASCGSKDSNKHKINPKVAELDETPDSALFVKLDKVANDSIYVTLRHTREKKVYGFSEANMSGQVKGSLTVGDELSIYPDNKNKRITLSINVTEMQGQWFYDMTLHRGFKFGRYGALSAINNQMCSYREWKLLNGKLYLYFVDMQQDAPDRHEYLVEEAEIKHLDKENMELLFRGALLNCRRQHEAVKF